MKNTKSLLPPPFVVSVFSLSSLRKKQQFPQLLKLHSTLQGSQKRGTFLEVQEDRLIAPKLVVQSPYLSLTQIVFETYVPLKRIFQTITSSAIEISSCGIGHRKSQPRLKKSFIIHFLEVSNFFFGL